jgi:hypothetical protein
MGLVFDKAWIKIKFMKCVGRKYIPSIIACICLLYSTAVPIFHHHHHRHSPTETISYEKSHSEIESHRCTICSILTGLNLHHVFQHSINSCGLTPAGFSYSDYDCQLISYLLFFITPRAPPAA